MALKVVSGTIWTADQPTGMVVIDWAKREMRGDSEKTHIRAIGPRGRFKQAPIVTVSLRAIRLAAAAGDDIEDFNIDTRAITQEQAEIHWEATRSSRVREISFLAIGESDPTSAD